MTDKQDKKQTTDAILKTSYLYFHTQLSNLETYLETHYLFYVFHIYKTQAQNAKSILKKTTDFFFFLKKTTD